MITDTKNVQMTLSMSPALEAKLARLAVASGSTEADVLLKAIALYEVALQAKLKGGPGFGCRRRRKLRDK